MRRALLYRSRQTGWLETDLIMGRWAAENLDKLTLPELQEYARIVQVMCEREREGEGERECVCVRVRMCVCVYVNMRLWTDEVS